MKIIENVLSVLEQLSARPHPKDHSSNGLNDTDSSDDEV